MASKHATKRQTKKRAQARRVKNEKQHQISLCMIVKNEEEFLPGCLDSVKGVVDEIIIVDTGSTDRTVEIARQYGAKVYHYEWNDDFAAARNESLKHATCGWILVLDADERLEPGSGPLLKAIAHGKAPKAMYACRIVNVLAPGEVSEHTVTRFFPGGGSVLFHGLIHERPVPTGEGCIRKGEPPCLLKGFTVTHIGYKQDVVLQREKIRRNDALVRDVLRRENSPYYRYKLGTSLFQQGRADEAAEELKKALELLAEQADDRVRTASAVQVRLALSEICMARRDLEGALRYAGAAVADCPESRGARFQYGRVLFEMGRIEESRAVFLELASESSADLLPPTDLLGFDPSICTWKARAMAAKCSLCLGDISSAAALLADAAGFLPRSNAYVSAVYEVVQMLKRQTQLGREEQTSLETLAKVLEEEAGNRAATGDERFEQGDYKEAADAYVDALRLGYVSDASLLAKIGYAQAACGRLEEAFTAYVQALRSRPTDVNTLNLLIELTQLFGSELPHPTTQCALQQAVAT
ncbi:MAG: glycosyltransferase [Firmicutes bacterium]|nr:glycosyltransferase [Bacillota bacterium]